MLSKLKNFFLSNLNNFILSVAFIIVSFLQKVMFHLLKINNLDPNLDLEKKKYEELKQGLFETFDAKDKWEEISHKTVTPKFIKHPYGANGAYTVKLNHQFRKHVNEIFEDDIPLDSYKMNSDLLDKVRNKLDEIKNNSSSIEENIKNLEKSADEPLSLIMKNINTCNDLVLNEAKKLTSTPKKKRKITKKPAKKSVKKSKKK